jgi:uncharacterized protein involved in exopolysaccharide biosynthesis
MKFYELEAIMHSQDVFTLAEIARNLNSSPQAVSNWKARDQVPNHIIAQVKSSQLSSTTSKSRQNFFSEQNFDENSISLSDILLSMAQQLKIIVLVPFITIFISFTYVKFIQEPLYVSTVKVLLPQSRAGGLGGLSGLASQFGVNVPSGVQADLSSPSLFPELLKSRKFAEKILEKKFYTEKYNKELPLLAILTSGLSQPDYGKDTLITKVMGTLNEVIKFDQELSFSIIKVTTFEPVFAKELAEVVLTELEALNRYFKSQSVNEKTSFIQQRIESVREELRLSEKYFKEFKEQNRQLFSPALQLEQDRLSRDVDVQKGIYLTLKQQLELAKIEEVQETSIVQVLDEPQAPLNPSNKKIKNAILLSAVLGLGIGIILGFIRSYLDNSNISERKKLFRVKNFIKKKSKDFIFDKRITGIISLLLIFGLPYYLSYKSKVPVYFGMYSSKIMLLNIFYVISLIITSFLFIKETRKK